MLYRMVEAFETLANGTLIDIAFDEGTRRVTIRAGTSLTPAERPVVLELEPVEQLRLVNHLIALWGTREAMNVAPLIPRPDK